MTDPTADATTEIPTVQWAGGEPSRRRVLVTGGVIVAAAAVTAACGSSSESATGSGPSAAGSASPAGSAGAAGSAGSAGSAGGGVSIPTADVPVGGGQILTDQKVVITQPTAGEFKAFSAVCTHQGCLVASIADGMIVCPCHQSMYSVADGSVTGGPAPAPLAPAPITVSGSSITLA